MRIRRTIFSIGGLEVKHWGQVLLFFLAVVAPLAPAHADSTVTCTYDALGRLVRSVSSGTSTADNTYTLDAADGIP